jgi:heptosyltransferase I
LETPVIGLYGHTDPRRGGPYRAYADLTIDRYNYDAAGQANGAMERDGVTASKAGRARRMELITVTDVVEKIQHAMARYCSFGLPPR